MVQILQLRFAGSICFHISHVAHMPLGGVWPGVRFVGWIKMRASGSRIGCAAIAEFMDMKAMISRGQARDLCMDLHAIGNFGKRDGAAQFVGSGRMKHRNRL